MLNTTVRIHSIESMGTVDGPGVRMVIFFQGCPMRCLYCHNPDSWDLKGGKEVSITSLVDQYNSKKAFYTNGGVTISGGEPLVQIDQLIILCKELKKNNAHVTIDTSGVMYNSEEQIQKVKELIKYVDLFLVDIKTINRDLHVKLTGHMSDPTLNFVKFLDDNNKKMWIRHVVVPNLTTDEDDLVNLGKYVKTLKNVEKIQLLPYHSMAIFKYEQLNIKYPLINTSDCDSETLAKARQAFIEGINNNKG